MKLTMFCFRKTYLGCSEPPMFSKEPIDSVVETYRRSILSNPDQAYQAKFNEIEIVHLGTFDDFEESFQLLEKPVVVCHCAKFFPPGYIAKKEAVNNA